MPFQDGETLGKPSGGYETLCEPFGVLPAGQRVITRPVSSWVPDEFTTTYEYEFRIDPARSASHVAICLNGTKFSQSFAAVIYGHAPVGPSMGPQHFVGSLGPTKLSSFFKISPREGTTGITLFIIVRPQSKVDEMVGENKTRERSGPLIEL
ncbi:hypothetical protein EV126DRAFT_413155, partial [Verticillium dahliae]